MSAALLRRALVVGDAFNEEARRKSVVEAVEVGHATGRAIAVDVDLTMAEIGNREFVVEMVEMAVDGGGD